MGKIKIIARKIHKRIIKKMYGSESAFAQLLHPTVGNANLLYHMDNCAETDVSDKARIYSPYKFYQTKIGDYTYISENSMVNKTTIGKFCSIGPNFFCGWGIHPTNGISTSPMFYSTGKQNGISFSKVNKIEERKEIIIGNDVFIGSNVIVLDGVTIGDGAVIGAGAVVSKDIPPYAIAIGSPIKIIKYRFTEKQIEDLLRVQWWNFDDDKLEFVEKMFFNIEEFLTKFNN